MSSFGNNPEYIIVDTDKELDTCLSSSEKNNAMLLLWRKYNCAEISNAISVPQIVEENCHSLRDQYLRWVYSIGYTVLRGSNVADHLVLPSGISSWWMSPLVEKCNFSNSLQINDAIRLLALVSWLRERNVERLRICTANSQLAECIGNWCATQNIQFFWEKLSSEVNNLPLLQRTYQSLPHPVRAIIWLFRYLASRWALRGAGVENWKRSKSGITFVSYFLNVMSLPTEAGVFQSQYWGNLPGALEEEGRETNWLHMYIRDGVHPTAKSAAEKIDQFNRNISANQNHVTLDSFLTLAIIGKTIREWFFLLRKRKSLQMETTLPPLDGLELWPLYKEEWSNFMSGDSSIRNVLTSNLFKSALSQIPKQRLGVYLLENQAWEIGLQQAWKTCGHGEIIGCAHTTVRFWDLRYFHDSRNYSCEEAHSMPIPDRVVVNGPAAASQYIKGGFPPDRLSEVEALRYLYLNKYNSASSVVQESRNALRKRQDDKIRVLVLGDYSARQSNRQMRLISGIADCMAEQFSIIVKPHPGYSISMQDYPNLDFYISDSSLSELLGCIDIAFTSSITSAAVDAYCAGVSIISVLDDTTLNLSPLRGCEGVIFIETEDELLSAIKYFRTNVRKMTGLSQFFNLDDTLPKWKRLIENYSIK